MVDVDFDPGESFEQMEYDELEFHERLQEELDIVLTQAAEIIRGWLQDYTPRRTSLTATSWYVVAFDRNDYYITNTNEPIITFLTEGTRPHIIASHGGHPLHWVDEEKGDMFALWVYHPGTEGIDIVGQALDAAEPELDQLWDMAIDAANRETLS
jgi:hypothetical protein